MNLLSCVSVGVIDQVESTQCPYRYYIPYAVKCEKKYIITKQEMSWGKDMYI